jgi:hypothetical protein
MPCLVVCAYTHQEDHPLALLSFQKKKENLPCKEVSPKEKAIKGTSFFFLSLSLFN